MKRVKLTDICKDLPEDKQAIALGLAEECEFIKKELKKLRKTIKEEGSILEGVSGNGFQTVKEHPAVGAYNKYLNNYKNCIQKIADTLNIDTKDLADDEFTEFLK